MENTGKGAEASTVRNADGGAEKAGEGVEGSTLRPGREMVPVRLLRSPIKNGPRKGSGAERAALVHGMDELGRDGCVDGGTGMTQQVTAGGAKAHRRQEPGPSLDGLHRQMATVAKGRTVAE